MTKRRLWAVLTGLFALGFVFRLDHLNGPPDFTLSACAIGLGICLFFVGRD
jgi:hypothetical protein